MPLGNPKLEQLFLHVRDIHLNNLRVAELKLLCRDVSASTYGLKRVLQDAVKARLNAAWVAAPANMEIINYMYWVLRARYAGIYAQKMLAEAGVMPTEEPPHTMVVFIPLYSLGPNGAVTHLAANMNVPTAHKAAVTAPQRPAGVVPTAGVTAPIHHLPQPNQPAAVNRPHPHKKHTSSSGHPKHPVVAVPLPKFINSPFYEIVCQVDRPRMIPLYSRSPLMISCTLKPSEIALLNSTLSYHARMSEFTSVTDIPKDFPKFVYSLFLFAAKQDHGPVQVPIEFPHKPAISVNGKKASTFVTRSNQGPVYIPVDLTSLIVHPTTKTIPVTSNVIAEFELAHNNYNVYFCLVKNFTVGAVFDLITSTPACIQPTASVRANAFARSDDDVTPVNLLLGLKCPILYTDIHVPARGMNCKHLQCFDLYNYLMVQKLSETWTCPLCHERDPQLSTGVGHQNLVTCTSGLQVTPHNAKLLFASQEAGGIRLCGYTMEIIDEIEKKHSGDYDSVAVRLTDTGDWTVIGKEKDYIPPDDFDKDMGMRKRKRSDSESVDENSTPQSPPPALQNSIVITTSPAPAALSTPVIIDLTLD